MTPSRRESLQWMLAAAALPMARLSSPAIAGAPAPAFATVAPWPDTALPPVTAPGYGTDPNLQEPSFPWPLTLDAAQRDLLNLLGNIILPPDDKSPGAGDLNIAAFLDEWASAPYPQQQKDRERIVHGLQWLDAQSGILFGTTFGAATGPQRQMLLDALLPADPPAALAAPAAFFDTLRSLMVLGFYSLPEGQADMGFIGNQPTPGDYPGPEDAALAHLQGVLRQLDLA